MTPITYPREVTLITNSDLRYSENGKEMDQRNLSTRLQERIKMKEAQRKAEESLMRRRALSQLKKSRDLKETQPPPQAPAQSPTQSESQLKLDQSLRFVSMAASNIKGTANVGQTLSLTPVRSGFPLAAIVRNMSDRQICVELPWPDSSMPLSAGDFVKIEFWDPETSHSFDSQVLSVDPTGKKLEIARSARGKTAPTKKRVTVQKFVPLSFEVIESENRELIGKEVVNAKAFDVGIDSLRCKTDLPLKLRDQLKITLALPEETSVVGWVKGHKPLKGKGRGPAYSLAVRFVEMEPQDHNNLMLFVARSHAERSPREISGWARSLSK